MIPNPCLSREDTNDDDSFLTPRLVIHIDDNACERLKKILQEPSERRSRSSLEQMWSKLFNCCKISITKKDVKSLAVNWSAQRTVASKHPPFGTDEYSQFSEFPKSFFLHRSWGHNYLWPSTSGFPAIVWSQSFFTSL